MFQAKLKWANFVVLIRVGTLHGGRQEHSTVLRCRCLWLDVINRCGAGGRGDILREGMCVVPRSWRPGVKVLCEGEGRCVSAPRYSHIIKMRCLYKHRIRTLIFIVKASTSFLFFQ